MAGKKRWTEDYRPHGILHVSLRTFRNLTDYVEQELLNFPDFIYRGHANAEWALEPSLDRILRTRGRVGSSLYRRRHLQSFKLAVRGRRGPNPASLGTDLDWWALGQHEGLATPLLDWTRSPFVAAYFAFEDVPPQAGARRAIFAIDRAILQDRSDELRSAHVGEERAPIVEFIDPLLDESARLVSQRGLFTWAPDGVHIEEWIRASFPEDHRLITLIKIEVPSSERLNALRELNRMNINRSSLFPDISGACRFCNLELQIDGY